MMAYNGKQQRGVVSCAMRVQKKGKTFYRLGICGGLLASLTFGLTAGLAQTTSTTPPAPSQERFLQHFISNSLAQPVAPQAAAPGAATSPAGALVETPAPPVTTVPAPAATPPSLTAAAFRMVLGLGGILAVVVAGGYGVRRFLLERPLLGKRDPMMRVLGRVSLTPKAGVALVEVPGKILVLGMTGQSITVLSDLPASALPSPAEASPKAAEEDAAELPETSFEAALKHHRRGFESMTSPDIDPLATVSQAIHRKISGLKQL